MIAFGQPRRPPLGPREFLASQTPGPANVGQ
jgi:hypothetical protein